MTKQFILSDKLSTSRKYVAHFFEFDELVSEKFMKSIRKHLKSLGNA